MTTPPTNPPFEHTGPFNSGDWCTGARVRFADNGGATLDLVKAPQRLVYRHAGQEHETFGRREALPTECVRFRVAPWVTEFDPATAIVIVPLENVVTLEDRGDVLAEGMINGPAIACYEDGNPVPDDGGDDVALANPDHWLVPCWTAREGRESTTVYVDSRNVVAVILPEPWSPASRARKPGAR